MSVKDLFNPNVYQLYPRLVNLSNLQIGNLSLADGSLVFNTDFKEVMVFDNGEPTNIKPNLGNFLFNDNEMTVNNSDNITIKPNGAAFVNIKNHLRIDDEIDITNNRFIFSGDRYATIENANNDIRVFSGALDVITSSGPISLFSGTNQNINLTPHGTGKVLTTKDIIPPADLTVNLGAANNRYANIYAGVIHGTVSNPGGSSFGNLSLAITDANTISTTTGNLKLTGATNKVNVCNVEFLNNQISTVNDVDLFLTTAGSGDIVALRRLNIGNTFYDNRLITTTSGDFVINPADNVIISNLDVGVVKSTNGGVLSAGPLVNNDISNSAGITDNKLNTLTSSGKVANSATTATSVNTGGRIVSRDLSGDFSANIITASLNGNAATATSSMTFTGALSGDVIGLQTSTSVSYVGGSTATAVNDATILSNNSTQLNNPGQIVKRDGSGNFSAGIITAYLNGTASAAALSFNAVNLTGPLLGDVVGTQAATSVSFVGGSTAVNINSATILSNNSTPLNSFNQIVKRDGTGNFSASGITLSTFGAGIVRSNASGVLSSGTIQLNDNTDVLISAPANNQVLTYNASTSKWINKVNAAPMGEINFNDVNTLYTLVIPLQNTYYKLTPSTTLLSNGVKFIQNYLSMPNSGELQYGGSVPVYGSLTLTLSGTTNSANKFYQVQFFINGTPYGNVYYFDIANSNVQNSRTYAKIILLNPNDIISVYFKCVNDTNRVLSLSTFTLTLTLDQMN